MNARAYTLKVEDRKSDFKRVQIGDAADAARYARQFYFDDISIYESMFIILLNRANRTIGWAKVSQGGVDSTVCDVKLVCKYAIDTLASGVIMVHNHPSGLARPGESDIRMTERVKKALNTFDVSLLDHVILSPEGEYYSFSDESTGRI